jgi:DNA polymerase elongation subunit (family B)
MIKLFLDIETLPCDDDMKETVVAILQKKNGNKEKDPEQLFLETGFDGTFGRICCIGYIKEYQGGAIEKGVLRGDEETILKTFWDVARDATLFVGHNVLEFDLPFIYQRSMVRGIRPSQQINFARYRNFPIFDTMKEWTKWAFTSGPKLDTLAKVLKLKTSKDAMDGSEVYQYFLDGKLDDICAYCMKDVVLTRQVYYRMNFEEASDIPGIEELTTVNKAIQNAEIIEEPKHEEVPHVITASVVPNQTTLIGETDEIPF